MGTRPPRHRPPASVYHLQRAKERERKEGRCALQLRSWPRRRAPCRCAYAAPPQPRRTQGSAGRRQGRGLRARDGTGHSWRGTLPCCNAQRRRERLLGAPDSLNARGAPRSRAGTRVNSLSKYGLLSRRLASHYRSDSARAGRCHSSLNGRQATASGGHPACGWPAPRCSGSAYASPSPPCPGRRTVRRCSASLPECLRLSAVSLSGCALPTPRETSLEGKGALFLRHCGKENAQQPTLNDRVECDST